MKIEVRSVPKLPKRKKENRPQITKKEKREPSPNFPKGKKRTVPNLS